MSSISVNHSTQTFHDLLAGSDENTITMAIALESFVDSVMEHDAHQMLVAWKMFHSAIEEKVEKRVQFELTKQLNAKQLDSQLREYSYNKSEGVRD